MNTASALQTAAWFLPGWGLGRGPLVPALAGSGWQLLDLPGTQAPVPTHFDAAVEALLAALPARCHLGGWSLGTLLALAAAARAPERIVSLTLVAATPSFLQRPDWPHGLSHVELEAFAAGVAKMGSQALPRFIHNFCRGDAAARAAARALGQQATPPAQAVLDAGLAWLGQADLRHAVASIACPTTLIHGAADPLMPLAAAHWLADHLPKARLIVLPGKAHAPFAPDPVLFLEVLPRP